ncbi:MAG: DEAD/DEAH box helicase [Phycisphaerales bacterium]|nr:DEAD/DEAH box helicase [Phycisphaerales bacterium]
MPSVSLLVLHAQWSDGPRQTDAAPGGQPAAAPAALHLWAEDAAGFARLGDSGGAADPEAAIVHPFTLRAADLRDHLLAALGSDEAMTAGSLQLSLPCASDRPLPSPQIAHHADSGAFMASSEDEETVIADPSEPVAIRRCVVQTVVVPAADVARVLEHLEDLADPSAADEPPDRAAIRWSLTESTRFYAAAAKFVRHLLAQQRFVPMLAQDSTGTLRGVWQPWLGDRATAERLTRLVSAMPASARAADDGFGHDGHDILDDFVLRVGDALCRRTLRAETMADALEGRDTRSDSHAAWLSGLLGAEDAVQGAASGPARTELVKNVRRWIGGLEDRGSGASWRLLVKLQEPLDLAGLGEFTSPGDRVRWPLSFLLQSTLDEQVTVEAAQLWMLPAGAASVEGLRIEAPHELLLAELGRAARLYRKFEKALEESEPAELDLTTSEAYQFLKEVRPLLIEQGFGVEAPEWWDSPTVRLGARLQVQSEEVDFTDPAARAGSPAPGSAVTHLGLSSLVSYRWQIAVGDTNLTLEQFERLAAQHSPLVRVNGRWVEIRPEDVKAAMRFIRENPGGRMEVGRALRLAYSSEAEQTGIPILGMDATGWVATVFGDAKSNEKLPMLASPRGFVGTLRPYQIKGLSWLAFLDRFGLGSCLADDMGLGKTIQLLALLAHERAGVAPAPDAPRPAPTLLVVPMSVVSNWVHEARRFTPDLKVLVQHGAERKTGESLFHAALAHDMVITTYALAHRDREDLAKIAWSRVVLDEAQNIKNPGAKQTRAIHAIDAPRRIALTGTPVENRLTELWSIMDFLNPAYLGSGAEFRRRFALPIERYHDKHRGSQLRGLVQPFVLRRLKSDPTVISDLPEKVESREYCYLTQEQATLYQTVVSDMLSAAEKSDGIQRRGLVLAGLIKLKQVCNHPAHFLKETASPADGSSSAGVSGVLAPARSGKCQRLVEMLQEVVAAGDKALVFTQFRQMGHMLQAMLRQMLDRDVLFLHGGSSAAQRPQIIDEFQGQGRWARGGGARAGSGGPPVLVLSLKAGGVGLNLTAANHVFHFDRWWNPAVENQATDRAYRIGQTRTVQVHKFVVSGTLEERIDQMIEEKTALASEIVGSGEDWLTEMSTGQLRDLLTLRTDAVEDAELVEEGV